MPGREVLGIIRWGRECRRWARLRRTGMERNAMDDGFKNERWLSGT